MKRAIAISVALGLLLAPTASAKLVIRAAEACGALDCRTLADNPGHLFKLLSPTFRSQHGGATPPSFETLPRHLDSYLHYRVTLTTGGGTLDNGVISVTFLPEPNYIRVVDARRTGGLVHRGGWLRLGPEAANAYAKLAAGLTPLGPEASRDSSEETGAAAWRFVGLAGGIFVLAGLLGFVWVGCRK